MSTWRRHRAHRYSRASSIAAPGGEGWTIRNHRAILRSEPYARADLGAASDLTAKSNLSEAAPVSPAPAISPQRHSAVIASAHGDGISGNIGSGGKHVPGGVAGTVQCVLGRPSQITSRPDLHHLSALFGRRRSHRISGLCNRRICRDGCLVSGLPCACPAAASPGLPQAAPPTCRTRAPDRPRTCCRAPQSCNHRARFMRRPLHLRGAPTLGFA